MLSISNCNKKGVFERVISAPDGALLRVRFEVYEVGGLLKGRIITVEPIISVNTVIPASSERMRGTKLVPDSDRGAGIQDYVHNPLCLPCASSNLQPQTSNLYFLPVTSPYFSLEYLINSQPTRAPSMLK